MDKNAIEHPTSKDKEIMLNPAEIPETWRQFYDEVRKLFADEKEPKE